MFKTVFAIHDFHKEFSYATQIDVGNPQTIIWRTEHTVYRKNLFDSIESIQSMSYFDLLDNAYILLPVEDATAYELIGMELTPIDYKRNIDFKKIVKNIKTVNEAELIAKKALSVDKK